MRRLVREKDTAIQLRKKGYSYAEIQKRVPVAKSSLSLWLKDTRLTEDEKRVLKRRKSKNIEKGRIKVAAILRKRRVVREQLQLSDAHRLYALHRSDPLFLVGVALYWAEGTKRSNSFAFINSDPHMITVMVEWLERFFAIPRTRIKARLYIHKHYAHEMCENFGAGKLAYP